MRILVHISKLSIFIENKKKGRDHWYGLLVRGRDSIVDHYSKIYWHSYINLSIAQRWKTPSWYSRTIWHKTTLAFCNKFSKKITGSWSISAKTVLWRLSLTAWWTHLALLFKNSFVERYTVCISRSVWQSSLRPLYPLSPILALFLATLQGILFFTGSFNLWNYMKNLDDINANLLWISNVMWPWYLLLFFVDCGRISVPLTQIIQLMTLKSKEKENQVELQDEKTFLWYEPYIPKG